MLVNKCCYSCTTTKCWTKYSAMLNHSFRLWCYFRQNSNFFYAKLLLWIYACFYNPVFDLYNPTLSIHHSTFRVQNPIFSLFNSTLCIDNSTSIFQILFTCDILVLLLRKTKGHILNPTFLCMSRWHQKPWEGLDCGTDHYYYPLLSDTIIIIIIIISIIIIIYHYYFMFNENRDELSSIQKVAKWK